MRSAHAVALIAALASQLLLAGAFTSSSLPTPLQRTIVVRHLSSSDASSGGAASGDAASELFASAGWPTIKKDLDECPVFTVANKKGQPLQYSVGGKAMPFFFTDLDAAKEELEKACADSTISDMEGMDDIDIIPFPLGDAFVMMETGKGVIVPSKQAIEDAGAPKDASPLGQQVPLFACMTITQEGRDGKPLLPLFFVKQEVQNAIDEALAFDGDDGQDEFAITCISLQKAVELLATNQQTAFNFLPPQKSLQHIKEYLEG